MDINKHLVVLDKDKDCGNKVKRIRAKYKETPPDPLYKGLFELYYENSTSEDIIKIYESLIERSNKLNNKVKENNDDK